MFHGYRLPALGRVLLVVCALAGAGRAAAADADAQEREIKALARALHAVQAQLKQLAEQNRALAEQNQTLLQQQRQIERQLAANSAGAIPGTAPAPAAPAAGMQADAAAPTVAANSALPDSTSALPDQTSNAGTISGTTHPGTDSPAPTPGGSAVQSGTYGYGALQNLRLWGYGELYYTRPQDAQRTQADLARAVFGIGYQFDSRTEFNSEYEVEHAVVSATDPGEFEVEQFYIDHQLTDPVALRAGLFLMPFGFLNEHHEPTRFYGVQRNFVETLIIPSTWREGGLGLHGTTELGLAWNAGITTGVDLSKWQFSPTYPAFTTALDLENNASAPLQATHQELALANGRHLSQYVALNYFGLPGLDVGGAAFTGKAVPAPGTAGDSRVTLWEGHARWTPGQAELTALYSRGSISNVARANLQNPGAVNPIPSAFYGYYLQAAYDVWEHNEYRLSPFARWEYFDMGSQYSGTTPVIPTGLVPLSSAAGDLGTWPRNRDRVWTVGANLYVTSHVVFKADYQWFDINRAFNRFDLGLGVSF